MEDPFSGLFWEVPLPGSPLALVAVGTGVLAGAIVGTGVLTGIAMGTGVGLFTSIGRGVFVGAGAGGIGVEVAVGGFDGTE